jgi:hypothetical protein
MPSAVAARRGVKFRHTSIPVAVPEDATEEEADELVAQALYRAYRAAARRVGAKPLPAEVARPRPRASAYPSGPPSPSSAQTAAEFLDCMRALKKWAKVSYEKLEQRAGTDADGASRLPHSSMNRLLAKSNDSRLPDDAQLTAFVLACGLSEEQWREWAMVWADIKSTGEAGSWPFPALLDRVRFRNAGVHIGTSFGVAHEGTPHSASTWQWSPDGKLMPMQVSNLMDTTSVVIVPTYTG